MVMVVGEWWSGDGDGSDGGSFGGLDMICLISFL